MIIADTGFWLALANRNDRYHTASQVALERYAEPLVTTWPVITETCHLLANRLSVAAEIKFIRAAEARAFEIVALQIDQLTRVAELMQQYRNLPMDLADASLVVLAEKLGSGRIFSTDRRDFSAYRWKECAPFENLLELGEA